jgi:hypothetical protein
MTVVCILRAAPVATNADLLEPEKVEHHELYARSALEPVRELADVPICIDHFKVPAIGHVTALRTDDDLYGAGTWIYIHARIDDPPSWLRKGTPVSIARASVQSRTPWDAEWSHVQRAILNEVSLLSPGLKPAHPGARVEWIGAAERSPAAERPDRRFAAGEVLHDSGQRLVRRGIGQVLGVR